MSRVADRRRSTPSLFVTLGVVLVTSTLGRPGEARSAEAPAKRSVESTAEERNQLFMALLRRRAERLLEKRRKPPPPPPPPPPLVSTTTSFSEGYESNVNLDGEKRGDFYTEERLGLTLQPKRVTPWLSGELSYDLLNTHYAELRDSNLWMNTLGAEVSLAPHQRASVDLGYEYSIANFPFSTDDSFFDHRTSVDLALLYTSWLTQKVGWTYQSRTYDTRKARDPGGTRITELVRGDQRHTGRHELLFRFPKTSLRVATEYYQNFSNELFQEFYDWQDVKVRSVVSRVLGPQWIGIYVQAYERRNYEARNVPSINVAERDNLYTSTGLLTYQWHPSASLTYSLTYRYQDSNDPRLDFLDFINELSASISF